MQALYDPELPWLLQYTQAVEGTQPEPHGICLAKTL